MTIFQNFLKRGQAAFLALVASVLLFSFSYWPTTAQAHSVGQVQATKYFAPETIQLLRDRLNVGQPGLQVGDTINYIIQFTPIANGSTIGAGGWVTDYIPAGTVVTGAWFVQPNGSGGFSPVSPPSVSRLPDGWGSAQNTFNANWTNLSPLLVAGNPTLVACNNAGKTLTNCNARMSELHADTGIFYSTDPRTAVNFSPSTDGRIRQQSPFGSGNGYNILPTLTGGGGGGGPLITLLGGNGTNWSTHNYWDAAMTNAFGSATVTSAATLPASPRASNFVTNTAGRVTPPFNTASPVAGPDTGYQLDYTGNVGPWQRIYYPGSTVGTNSNGPALAAGTGAAGVVAGTYTNSGWGLSANNPLPNNTNAVRWAAGRLVVGNIQYVKISLRLTATPPSTGLINNSEVFGGDASLEDGTANPAGGIDNPWLYAIPSIADNNSNLYILKSVVGVCSGGTLAAAQACAPIASGNEGAIIPSGFVKLRYRLLYLNSDNAVQTDVKLVDVLPYSTGDVKTIEAGNVYVISGTDIRSAMTTSGTSLSNNIAGVGAVRGANVALTSLLATTAQQSATFVTIPSLAGGGGGSIELDVIVGTENGATATALATGTAVSNAAGLSSTQVTTVKSTVTSYSSNTAYLQAVKTTSTPSVTQGGTATYTITLTNSGNVAASTLVVNDFLPSDGGNTPSLAAHAFTGVSGLIIRINNVTQTGANNPTPVLTTPATVAPYTGQNRQQATWTFPAALTIPAGQSMTITFTSAVGANMAASTAPYTNDVSMTYNNLGAGAAQNASAVANDTAPITVTANISLTKTIDCVYNTAGTICAAYTGTGLIPSGSKVRYKLVYTNTSATAQTNVYVCDRISSSQTTPALTSTISQPTIAPTPTGPYQDTPPIGVPTQIVAATAEATACGYSGANTYAYPVIASLAGNASGTVYVDLVTNVTNTSTLTNTGKVSNTTSVVSAVARDQANLVVSKTTATPVLNVGGTATYTITLTNTGNLAAGNIRVYDFLPFVGTTADATLRFNYLASPAPVITTLSAVSPATVAPPTITPNSNNPNQQQVQWNFGAGQTLAPGATATITFSAQAGSAMAAGSTVYGNDVQVTYTHGATGTAVVSNGITNTAPITIPITLSLAKTIDCVFVGATCTPGSYVIGSALPVNAKIRYKLSYQNISTNPQTSVVLSDSLPSQTAANAVTDVVLVSGTSPSSLPPNTTITPANAGGATLLFNFATIPTLAAGASGVVTFDVQTNAALGATVTNLGKIASTQDAIGQTSSVSAVVSALLMTKTIDCVYSGATCTAGSYVPGTPITGNAKIRYKITYSNPGAVAINTISICDQLPSQIVAASATYVTNFATGTGTAPTGGQTYPAGTPCGFTDNNNFRYTNTMNLAAGGSGTVLFDVQTNAGANAVVTNLGKLVAGAQIVTSSVSATVGAPRLVLAKTASPTAAYLNGTVTYTMTVSNTGSIPTTTLKTFDFLPFSGTAVDPTKRFAFDPTFTPTFTYTGTPAGTPTLSQQVPPTIAPYSNNPNQQQLLWDFGAYALPPGGSIAITFRVTVGSAMPQLSYYNIAYAEFTSSSGPGSTNAPLALVSVSNPQPSLVFLKTATPFSDPYNLTTNPKNIPGALVDYTLRVTNTGPGVVDNNTLFVIDPVPANTELFLGDLSGPGSGPISFTQGTPSSGLTYTFGPALTSTTDDLEFSNDGGVTWNYFPPATPFDQSVTPVNRIRINPKGIMGAASAGNNPYFEMRFRVRIK